MLAIFNLAIFGTLGDFGNLSAHFVPQLFAREHRNAESGQRESGISYLATSTLE